MLNSSVQDLVAVTASCVLFPLFVFIPGYVLAFALGLLQFRERTTLMRAVLSVPLSIALTPILVFFLGRISFTLILIGYLAIWITFAVMLALPRFRPFGPPVRKSAVKIGLLIGLGLAILLCLSLIDLQWKDRLYYSMSAYDYNFRAAVIDSIDRRGVPPINPFLHAGHDAPFRYHYFWFLVCSLVARFSAGLLSARQVQIGGSIWMGLALCCAVAAYLRIFDPKGPREIRKRTLAGLFLLTVSGLDIIPVAMKSVSNIIHHVQVGVFGSAEWWSADPVTSWIHALLWVPHHVGGLLACLIGFLILWDVPASAGWRTRAGAWIGAGLSFASAAGLSIHVTFAFACGMASWGAVTLWNRWFRRTVDIALAGLFSVVIAIPYLQTLASSGASGGSGASHGETTIPLVFGVRQFRPVDALLMSRGASAKTMVIADLMSLPLHYLAEFGFFALIAGLFLSKMRNGTAETREYRFAVGSILLAVLLVCTFVRSSVIGNNDLGWRGILIAQFLLLIVSVDYFLSLRFPATASVRVTPVVRSLLMVFLWAGILPSIFELATQRLHPVLMDVGWVAPDSWAGEEVGAGERAASLRQVYSQLSSRLSAAAVVQHNPDAMQDIPSGLYADRQRVLMGSGDYTSFGGNTEEQERARAALLPIFQTDSTEARLESACRQLGIAAVIVKNNDPVWLNKASWVWIRHPLVSSPAARAFACSASIS